MSAAGLSKSRLGCLRDVMAGYVERGDVPGLVTLVSRRGETHVDALGMMAVGGREPMRRDTIFRIASMTKPITAAAAMILVEECKLRLTSRWTGYCLNSPRAGCSNGSTARSTTPYPRSGRSPCAIC